MTDALEEFNAVLILQEEDRLTINKAVGISIKIKREVKETSLKADSKRK